MNSVSDMGKFYCILKDGTISEIINLIDKEKENLRYYEFHRRFSLKAIEFNRLDVLKYCIESEADNLAEMFSVSIINDRFDIFMFLLKNINNIDKSNIKDKTYYHNKCLKNACKFENFKVLNYFIRNGHIINYKNLINTVYKKCKSDKIKIYLNYHAYLKSNKEDIIYIKRIFNIFNILNKEDKKYLSVEKISLNTIFLS